MSPFSDAFLAKARESLAGAESEFANARYNNVANRAYYACYQVAVVALDLASVRPRGGSDRWSHGFVQAQFAGLLVNRRKLYPTVFRDTLIETMELREQADYETDNIGRAEASRALTRARAFVTAVTGRGGTTP